MGIGLTLDHDASGRIVVFHWSVSAEANVLDARQSVKTLLDGAIKGFELTLWITSRGGVDVNDVAICGIELEVRGLKSLQRLREQTSANEEDEGHGSLRNDEPALKERSRRAGAAGTGAESVSGFGFSGDPSGRYAEKAAGEQREREGKGEDG